MYDATGMPDLVQRWWNGRWGRLARRDVRLVHQQRWTVEAVDGGVEGKVKTWTFDSEDQARELVNRLLAVGDGWREI
jgi:hypothetical protein